MPTAIQISMLITRASQYRESLVEADLTLEHSGCRATWKSICLSHLIQAMTFLYFGGDYVSKLSQTIYDKLSDFVGTNALIVNAINPNAQLPINTVVISGSYVPPDPLYIPIPVGTVSPFIYTYTGSNKIQTYLVELNVGGGNYYFAPNIQVERNANVFTITGDFSADAYRLTLVLA